MRTAKGTVLDLRAQFRRLAGQENGNIAVMFSLAIAPLLFMVGAAIDYSGASDLRSRLQRATDAAGLQLCRMTGSPTEQDLEARADLLLAAASTKDKFTRSTPIVPGAKGEVKLSTTAAFPTAVVRAFGGRFATVNVSADATCQDDEHTFEIAMVLDNTGSMSQSSGSLSKIEALRQAAKSFVDSIYSTPQLAQTKMSLVPFSASVAVNPTTYRNATWIDQTGKSSYHWQNINKAKANTAGMSSRFDVFTTLAAAYPAANPGWDWLGCFESLPFPLNTQDGAPSASNLDSYYVPLFAPDEAGTGGSTTSNSSGQYYVNSYIDDYTTQNGCKVPNTLPGDAVLTANACKYKSMVGKTSIQRTLSGEVIGATGPNFACASRPLTRLTNTKTTLTSEISAMQAAGTTNIHEGFMWGWRTLSPNSVFAEGAAYAKPLNTKIIILMTDGTNTWGSYNLNTSLKTLYSAYGYFANADGSTPGSKPSAPRLATGTADPTNETQARAAMDALTLAACKNAAAAPNNIVIYTIAFSTPSQPIDQQGLDMLSTCAGSPSRAFLASDSNALQTVFQQIAQSIGSLRLTR